MHCQASLTPKGSLLAAVVVVGVVVLEAISLLFVVVAVVNTRGNCG